MARTIAGIQLVCKHCDARLKIVVDVRNTVWILDTSPDGPARRLK